MSSAAELIADKGEAAVSQDTFRSREFFDVEGVTHTLRIDTDDGVLLAPLQVEPINDGPELDATSPYGYPGLLAPEGVSLDPGTIDFAGTGLVSIFLRHRMDIVPLRKTSARNLVRIADPSLPRKVRPQDRRQIAKNVERGCEVRIVPGAETEAREREAFAAVYGETMFRREAEERYRYPQAYFDRLLEAEGTWLALAEFPGQEVAAASILILSDGFLHYYLSGASTARSSEAPTKNVVSALVDRSIEFDLPLNLGGGLGEDDSLDMFKRGFANRSLRWHTSEIVCDEARYAELAAGREAGGYFPAYRAP